MCNIVDALLFTIYGAAGTICACANQCYILYMVSDDVVLCA